MIRVAALAVIILCICHFAWSAPAHLWPRHAQTLEHFPERFWNETEIEEFVATHDMSEWTPRLCEGLRDQEAPLSKREIYAVVLGKSGSTDAESCIVWFLDDLLSKPRNEVRFSAVLETQWALGFLGTDSAFESLLKMGNPQSWNSPPSLAKAHNAHESWANLDRTQIRELLGRSAQSIAVSGKPNAAAKLDKLENAVPPSSEWTEIMTIIVEESRETLRKRLDGSYLENTKKEVP